MTITIQIGNSDDKLSQADWSDFVYAMRWHVIEANCPQSIHFSGGSSNAEKWQNYAFVFEATEEQLEKLKEDATTLRKSYKQDSVAFTIGETKFI